MLRKSRLKKERVNLRTLKNNKLLYFIAILLIGCYIYLSAEVHMPEDESSSGMSVVRRSMDAQTEEIDNFLNVENYKYRNSDSEEDNVHLKNTSFSFLENIILPMDMYPQGICFTEQYLMVTMYSAESDALGIVKIFDKASGEYLMSLGMDSKSHLGGIAYDGENIWVCNSSNDTVERISYAFICKAIESHEGKILDVRNVVEEYAVHLVPSCITYHDGKLWIATHSKFRNSKMVAYVFDQEENTLCTRGVYTIPAKVQGIAFDEGNRIYLSTSYGRKFSSYLKIYDSVKEMSKNVESFIKMIEMPPCSEGVAIEEDNIHVVFESASEKYLEGTDGYGKSLSPLDKILIIDRLFY